MDILYMLKDHSYTDQADLSPGVDARDKQDCPTNHYCNLSWRRGRTFSML